MPGRLVIDGNAVYEIDEECLRRQRKSWGKVYAVETERERNSEKMSGEPRKTAEQKR